MESSKEPYFGITQPIRKLLLEISASHADRLLRAEKKKIRKELARQNPVEIKKMLDKAIDRLLQLHKEKTAVSG